MADWERVQVAPDYVGVTRAERRGGSYVRYHPDRLADTTNNLDPSVVEYAADVSTALARLGGRLRANERQRCNGRGNEGETQNGETSHDGGKPGTT